MFSCIYCGRQYKLKRVLDNHISLCELLSKPIKPDPEMVLPNPKQMYQLIIGLSAKCNRLESRLAELEPFVHKQKKQINVLEWLNDFKPETTFDKFHESIQIVKEDIDFLFQNSTINTIQEILSREIYEKYDFPVFPVYACNAKTHIYIYEDVWQEATKEKMVRFLDKIHIKLIQQLSLWKRGFSDLNNANTELYNKATIKLMNMDFKKESVFGKIKATMYSAIKADHFARY